MMISRRGLLGMVAAMPLAWGQERDPWTDADLIYPPALAAELGKTPVTLLQVGFPALFHGARIPGSVYAGPGSKSEGIALLLKAVEGKSNATNIVIYCGCCPLERCPNVRPAFRALKARDFTNVKMLVLPTNLHTDWIEKGYAVDKS